MNTRTIKNALALPLLLAALMQPASDAGTAIGGGPARPSSDGTLAQQIAGQGNRALLQIRAESRLALQQRLSLPALPAPETAAR